MANFKFTNHPYLDFVEPTFHGKWDPRNQPITKITIHHTAGFSTLATLHNAIIESGRQSSWNYAIDSDGKIGLYVDEWNRAWTSSNADNDYAAVTIEVANNSLGPNWTISDAAYNSLLQLCLSICIRNGIPSLIYDPVKKAAGSNLTRHDWFVDKDCPGKYLGTMFPYIARQVNTWLQDPWTYGKNYITYQQQMSVSGGLTYDNVLTGGSNVVTSWLQQAVTTPYVVTIHESTPVPNWGKLKSKGIIGGIIEAGRLFNSLTHQKLDTFRNPGLESQIAAIQKAELDFGLFINCKARNISEAKDEVDKLANVIRAYTPRLGVWLFPEFLMSNQTNNAILQVYEDRLNQVGVSSARGIRVTPMLLTKFDWSRFCDTWYFWYVNRATTSDELYTQPTQDDFSIEYNYGNV